MSDQIQDRKIKRDKIRALGVDPYGERFPPMRAGRTPDALPRPSWSAEIRAAAEKLAIEPGQILDEGVDGAAFDAAGRVVLYRDIGSLIFLTVRDQTGEFQFGLSKKMVAEGWKVAKLLDLGDIVGVTGRLGRTKTGELTLWVTYLRLLSKAVRPPPEKRAGLHDVETRYRKRYIDLFSNPASRDVFLKRAAIISHARRVLLERGFVEVDTPVLQPIYGGAAARPFTTHHNTLDMQLYLRISPELYLKRCLVGGLDRVFEFSRCFRNEGISPRHNPEFTMLELYQAYGDYHDMMDVCEAIIGGAAREVIGTYRIATEPRSHEAGEEATEPQSHGATNGGQPNRDHEGAGTQPNRDHEGAGTQPNRDREGAGLTDSAGEEATEPRSHGATNGGQGGGPTIDFTPPWPRRKYAELFGEYVGVAIDDREAVLHKARQLGLLRKFEPAPDVDGRAAGATAPTAGAPGMEPLPRPGAAEVDHTLLVNALFEELVEPHLVNPTFVVDYPAPLCPLTKRDPHDPDFALRFELYINSMEMGNAYSELNDPDVQRETFSQQLAGEGDETMAVMDEDFVEALEYAMPPAGGLGIGIDRIVMLLTGSPSIRDVLLFPLQRPQIG